MGATAALIVHGADRAKQEHRDRQAAEAARPSNTLSGSLA